MTVEIVVGARLFFRLRTLHYEPNRINDSITFQRLDAAGNDTKSLERQESTVIGPRSDHTRSARKLFERSFFRTLLTSSFNHLQGALGLPNYLEARGKRGQLGWRP